MSGASDSVIIRAGARLHLGLVKINRKPEYIAAGLSLEEPFCKLVVKRSSSLRVSGKESNRIKTAILNVCSYTETTPKFSARLITPLPSHSGLGSGTRHSLCAAKAICLLESRRFSSIKLAMITGRGARSTMGAALFDKGGFTADIAGALTRLSVPRSWRVVVIDPDTSGTGHSLTYGKKESYMIAKTPACSARTARRLIDSVSNEMVAGIKEDDFKAFEKSLELLQSSAKKLFGRFQEGAASSNSGREILRYLRRIGVRAAGQSSWGPTLFAVFPSLSEAESVAEKVRGLKSVRSAAITRISNSGYRAEKT